MSQENFGLRSFDVDTTLATPTYPIAAYQRVKQVPASAGVAVAGAFDASIGTLHEPVLVSGDLALVKLKSYPGSRKVVCASTCNPGDTLYPTTNGQVDTLGASGGLGTAGNAIGAAEYTALEACATAGGIVEAMPIVGSQGKGLLFVSTGDSAAVTNTVTETAFATNQLTIAANTLKVGDVIKVRGRAVVTGKNAAETLTIKGVIGGTGLSGGAGSVTLFSSGAVNNSAADEISFDGQFIVTAIGATGKIQGATAFIDGAPGTATAKDSSLQSTTLATNAAVPLDITATWSGANAANTVVLRDLVVTLERQ